MRKKIQYEVGEKIGNCTFIKELPTKIFGKSKTVRRMMLFKCICGNEFEAAYLCVKSGNTKSCGCIGKVKLRELGLKNTKHGLRNHPLYPVWRGMLNRCEKPEYHYYKNYGGRGIKVCERWHDINNFMEDMSSGYIQGYDIDRINNDGNYEPSNCRWATRKVNSNNRRDNRLIEYNNMTKTISEWADYSNIPYSVLLSRFNKWKLEDVFTTPYPTHNFHNKVSNRYIEYKGVTKSMSQWATELNMSYAAFRSRMKNWSLEDTFNIPYPTHGGPLHSKKIIMN